jgi:hypothetical protein
MIALIMRPESTNDLSPYSIAVEAHEAALAGRPIAFLAENQDLVPRLIAALDHHAQHYTFAELQPFDQIYGPRAFDRIFERLAEEIRRRSG